MEYVDRAKDFGKRKEFKTCMRRVFRNLGEGVIGAVEQAGKVPGSLSYQSLRQLRAMKGPRTGMRRTR